MVQRVHQYADGGKIVKAAAKGSKRPEKFSTVDALRGTMRRKQEQALGLRDGGPVKMPGRDTRKLPSPRPMPKPKTSGEAGKKYADGGKVRSKAKPNSKAPLGQGGRFAAVERAAAKSGARNPAAVAAAVGRKKYGSRRMAKMAAAGRKR